MIIPTRDRRAILCETLSRLERQAGDTRFEVVVVNDGSVDGTADAVRERVSRLSFPLVLIEQHGAGPAAARNSAMAAANAPVCLFLNDDSWPHSDLLARHAEFHRRRPAREAALLGRVDLPSRPSPTPFMRWLAQLHFDPDVNDPENVGGGRFITANLSCKAEFLASIDGFDERFTDHEDIEAGLRLEKRGLELVYDPEAVVEHYHPAGLPMAIERMSSVGRSLALLVELHPGYPAPRRPGMRHRLKAGVLTGLAAAGLRTRRLQEETWRFLCHEATREAYWASTKGDRAEPPPGAVPRIGRTLARLASRDQDARMPQGEGGALAPHSQGWTR